MRQFILFLFISIFCFTSAKAQDNYFDLVYAQFVNEYKVNLEAKKNFFSAMSDASEKVFSLSNKNYSYLIKEQIKKRKSQTISNLSESTFDSLLSIFIRQDLWCDNKEAKSKYQEFFTLSYNKVCNCISPAFTNNLNRKTTSNPIDSCMRVLNNDQLYIKQVRELTSKYTKPELLTLGNYYSRYLFENCVAFQNDLLLTLKTGSASLYESDLRNARTGILMNLIQSYGKGNSKDVSEIFPDYKTYENDLKLTANDLYGNHYNSLYSQNPKQKSETEEITKTFFYFKDGKAILKCRIIYVVTNELGHPLLKSLRYIEPSKIPDRKKILKDLDKDDQTEIINVGRITD